MIFKLDINKIPQILKECFLFYSSKIDNYVVNNNQKQYKFNYTENSSLYNFSNFLKNDKEYYLNIDWLFSYFNYQFTYWDYIKEQKKLNGEICLIQLHWILGQKALKRFKNKTQKDSYFYHTKFLQKYKIKKENLIEYLENKKLLSIEDNEEKKVFNELNIKEEKLKLKSFNTIEGFYICLNYTSLYKFNSDVCIKCKYRKECKDYLKRNYFKLYQKRLAQKIMRDNNGKDN